MLKTNVQTKRYDELRIDDVILFYGGKLIITEVTIHHDNMTNQSVTYFKVKPFDDVTKESLGTYSYGEYGGNSDLQVKVLGVNL